MQYKSRTDKDIITNRQAGRQRNRQTDRQTDTGRQTGIQKLQHSNCHAEISKAYPDNGLQYLESLVYGSVGIKVSLRHVLVAQYGLQLLDKSLGFPLKLGFLLQESVLKLLILPASPLDYCITYQCLPLAALFISICLLLHKLSASASYCITYQRQPLTA